MFPGLMKTDVAFHLKSIAQFSPLPRYSGGGGLGVWGIVSLEATPSRLGTPNPLTPSLSP